jgi:hypothetical protein
MKLFSKFIFICNLCFLATAILRYIEIGNDHLSKNIDAISFQPLKSSLIVLGYSALLFNLIFFLLFILLKSLKKSPSIHSWLIIFNAVMLFVELIYFLF